METKCSGTHSQPLPKKRNRFLKKFFFQKSIRKIIYLKDRIHNLKCVPIKLEQNFKKEKTMLKEKKNYNKVSLKFLGVWFSVVNFKNVNTLRAHPEDSASLLRITRWTFSTNLLMARLGPVAKQMSPGRKEFTFHCRGMGRPTEDLELVSDGLVSPLLEPQQIPGSIQTSAEPYPNQGPAHN